MATLIEEATESITEANQTVNDAEAFRVKNKDHVDLLTEAFDTIETLTDTIHHLVSTLEEVRDELEEKNQIKECFDCTETLCLYHNARQ